MLLYNHDLITRFETDEQRKKHEALNRRVLVLLDKQFALRSNFMKYLLLLRSGTNIDGDTRKLYNAGHYLDNLFGYKDISRLEDYVRRYHGTKSKIKMDGDFVVVTIYTNKIGSYYKPDISLLRELKNYSLKVSRISKVIIIVINIQILAIVIYSPWIDIVRQVIIAFRAVYRQISPIIIYG